MPLNQTQIANYVTQSRHADTVMSKYERMSDQELRDGKFFIPEDFHNIRLIVNKDRWLAERWDALYNRFVEVTKQQLQSKKGESI